MTFKFNGSVFTQNDVRGVVGKGVCKELYYLIGKAFKNYIETKTELPEKIWVTVGKDVRLHSDELTEALIEGLTDAGINVITLGIVPSPVVYFSEYARIPADTTKEKFDITATLMVTASHNPSEYNGLKMTLKKSSFGEEDMANIRDFTKKEYDCATQNAPVKGEVIDYNIIDDYITKMTQEFGQIGKGLKIVVDCANATAGVMSPELYKKIGCEVVELYTEPDGNFPNHHPNPSDEKTLDDIKAKIKETNADFGIAFDGDADRVGIVDNTGYSIPGDQLLLILALEVLTNQKFEKTPVFVSEVKCSQVLFDMINKSGGKSIMWKTGHGYIKGKLREENAVLAGEMSGHIFFNDRFYGYDDATYAGARFIELVAHKKQENPDFTVSGLIESLPKACTSREVRFPCPNEYKKPVVADLKDYLDKTENVFSSKIEEIVTIDGLRIVFADGFALIRQSNTEPVFTMRFEAGNEKNLANYKDTLISLTEKILAKQST